MTERSVTLSKCSFHGSLPILSFWSRSKIQNGRIMRNIFFMRYHD